MENIKEKIEEIVEKLTKDEFLRAQFQKDPVKAVEKLLGVDLPDDIVDQVVKGVKGKMTADKLGGAVDALKKLF